MSFSRDNALDQALDIAGSFTQSDTLTLVDEPACLGAGTGNSGAAASITVTAVVTVTGLTGLTAASVGNFLTITGAATGANNGTFLISVFNSATSVEIINASAVTDANNGSISWTERQPYSLEDDLNYARTDRTAIKGVSYDSAIPTYFRCDDVVTPVPANLSNIAGNTTDAKSLVTNRQFLFAGVSPGDLFIKLSSTGNLKHADAVDRTGIPINDGADAGNSRAVYVEIIDGYGSNASLEVLSGVNAGNRIIGRTRAGGSTSPNSVEVEFRSVPDGVDISNSIPYTWEAGQPTTINVFYGFRSCLSDLDETALRTTLVNGLIGDSQLATELDDVREVIGVNVGDTDLSGQLTNTAAFFPFFNLPDLTPSVVEALNTLNEQIGDRTYTGTILTDGYTITQSLQELADAISSVNAVQRAILRAGAPFPVGSVITLPLGLSYTLDATNNGEGLLVFWRGILRDPGSIVTGDDYIESSTTTITNLRRIRANDHINFIVIS